MTVMRQAGRKGRAIIKNIRFVCVAPVYGLFEYLVGIPKIKNFFLSLRVR
jgi:hypothetical protein